MPDDHLALVRRICLELQGKKTFVTLHDDHHGDGRLALWCAPPGAQEALVVPSHPTRFCVPVGPACGTSGTEKGAGPPDDPEERPEPPSGVVARLRYSGDAARAHRAHQRA